MSYRGRRFAVASDSNDYRVRNAFTARDDDENSGCCASPGHCCSSTCKLLLGLLGTLYAYIYTVSYFFGESGTPQVLWISGVVVVVALIAVVVYGVANVCMRFLGDWPLTIIAVVAAVAVFGGLQIYLSDAIV